MLNKNLYTILILSVLFSAVSAERERESSCQSFEWVEHPRKGVFHSLGRGFNSLNTPCFPFANDMIPGSAVLDEVVRVHLASTRGNPDMFCHQSMYIPFGARCQHHIDFPDRVHTTLISDVDGLREHLTWLNQIEPEKKGFYCTDNVNFKQLNDSLSNALLEGKVLAIERIDIETHQSQTESFCDADLSGQFMNDVLNLPRSLTCEWDRQQYYNFLAKYGLSVINKVKVGGRAVKIRAVDPDHFRERNVEEFLRDRDVVFYGGDQNAISDSDHPGEAWQRTVKDFPITLKSSPTPIYHLVHHRYFNPNLDPECIHDRRKILQRFVHQAYYFPLDFDVMFSDGFYKSYKIGDDVYAPEGENVSNLRLLNREKFYTLSYFELDRKDCEASFFDSDNIIIDQFLGYWICDPTIYNDILYLELDNADTYYDQVVLFEQPNNQGYYNVENFWNQDTNVRGIFTWLEGCFSSFRFRVENEVFVDPSSYNFKIRWTDMKITYHNFGDNVQRLSQDGIYMADLSLLWDYGQTYFQLKDNEDDETYQQNLGEFMLEYPSTPLNFVQAQLSSSETINTIQEITASGVTSPTINNDGSQTLSDSNGFQGITIF